MAKRCRICTVEKEESKFYVNNSHADKLTDECKGCTKVYQYLIQGRLEADKGGEQHERFSNAIDALWGRN